MWSGFASLCFGKLITAPILKSTAFVVCMTCLNIFSDFEFSSTYTVALTKLVTTQAYEEEAPAHIKILLKIRQQNVLLGDRIGVCPYEH